jgi:heptosyltransferase III
MIAGKIASPAATGQPRFLVIRRDNIGDLVCTTPLIAALRDRYPQAWIAALVNRYAAPVLDNNPDLDAVFSYAKAKHLGAEESRLTLYWQRMRLMLDLRGQAFDYAILASPGYQASAERFARWVGARHVIGFDNGSGLADMTVPARTPRPLHQVENTFRLLGALGIEGPPPGLRLAPDADAVRRCRDGLPKQGGPVVGVHISAREADRRWPDGKFRELIGELLRTSRARVLLTWAPGSRDDPRFPGDDESARQLAAAFSGEPVAAMPTRELDQLIVTLAVCDLVICSDGGPVHLAAALGKPVVCFFGGEQPEVWHPWGVPYRLLRAPSRNASDIGVGEAISACAEFISVATGRGGGG